MDISFILVFLGVFLLSFILVSKKKENLPPGYYGFPVIGSWNLLRKLPGRRPHLVFYEESKRFGNIFRFYLGQQLVVVLSGFDIINEALVKKAEVFSDRLKGTNALLPKSDDEAGVIFCRYNSAWREARRFSLQALRDFGVGKTSIEERIIIETEAVTSKLTSINGKPTAIDGLMQKLVGNVIYSIIFGKRYEYDDPNSDKVRNMSNVLVSGPGPLTPSNYMPKFISRFLNKQGVELEVKRTASVKAIRKYIYELIDEHEATFDEDNIRDFVDLYIKTSRLKDESVKKIITKGNMFRVIVDLFIAGSETTSSTLDWAFFFMTEKPECSTKMSAGNLFGDKVIEYSERNKLVYVNATLMEIQRISAIGMFCNTVPLECTPRNKRRYDTEAVTTFQKREHWFFLLFTSGQYG
ncbi:cytochrome P450 2B4-like [Ruditapes philippinarum]|uniref:cytochrome P450 2B4-like n=1 Tax=Ruditapes philippinarum TaxID=129788 RepID=UPI00295B57B4|nr:cytochrome P450 2B4-like [Ruditapes philippinarum]